jgi:N-acetylneuraminic acid mutarotase
VNKIIQTSVIVLAVSLFLSTSLAPYAKAVTEVTEDSWTTMEPMPTARSSFGVAVVDGKIYAIGGFNGSNNYLAVNEMYDPETDTWTIKTAMPTARHEFATAVHQDKIYVIGGVFAANSPDFSGYTGVNEVYDPSTDTWETMEPMPTPRSRLQANVVGDKIYLIGGAKYSVIPPAFSQSTEGLNEVYDPSTDTWSTKTPDPRKISLYPSAVVENKIYILQGTTQIYNPETDSWSYGEAIPTGSFGATMAAAGATTGVLAPKRIYVFGGEGEGLNVAINLNQVYDPETDTWTNGTSMPTPRWALAVAVVNDELYAIGGYNGDTRLAVNEKYTPLDYIPEFPSWMLLLFTLVVLAVTLAIYKRRLSKIQ